MELFCDVQTEICKEMLTKNDEALLEDFDFNIDQASITQKSLAVTDDQQSLEGKIKKIGLNLQAIQESLHNVVNSI